MGRTTTLLALVVAMIPACASTPQNLTAGARCLRSTQCAPGLVCAGGVCTADLDGFGGTVPVIDAGPIDAPLDDAPLDDTGPLPDVPGFDAFVPMPDVGMGIDAGPPPVDAPTGMPDTPPDPPDAPPDMPDAPPDELDAGDPDAPP